MKKMKSLFTLTFVSLLLSCNESEDLITDGAKEGVILDISGSSWDLAGTPTYDVDSEESEVQFLSANMIYKVKLSNNSGENVQKLIVTKTYKGQTVKVTEANGGVNASLTVLYVALSSFSNGFDDVEASDFRIGDIISFETTIVMNDGSEYAYPEADLEVSVTCLSDLSGTYYVTNTCYNSSSPKEAEITQNDDGTWHLSSADGFFHVTCANGSLHNSGNITEQCGEILFSGDLDFGSDGGYYDIGDIQGGTWDANTGTLTMHHTQTFTSNWPSEWTSTYIRQ